MSDPIVWTEDANSFIPPAAEGLPAGALESAVAGAAMLDANADTPYGRNVLAHALIRLQRDGWLRDAQEGTDAAAPKCQQPGCAARTWGSCAHCTRPYCADHLTPVGEFSEPVCADDLAADPPS